MDNSNSFYTFARRTTDLEECVDYKKTFQAPCFFEALQQASSYWFNGQIVADWNTDSNSVVTLLSNAGNGNVIGTLIYHN